jgi:tetratricopeptide (TPR) repeat protein
MTGMSLLKHPPCTQRRSASRGARRLTGASLGAAAGIQRYQDLKRRSADSYDFAESELNTLGYYLLRQGELEAAIKIFRLNVEQNPDAYNTFDSLGEGLLALGDTLGAIDSYLKSVELNPANENGFAQATGQGGQQIRAKRKE